MTRLLVLPLILTVFLAGCRSVTVVPLDRALMPEAEAAAPAQNRYTAVVGPFRDARNPLDLPREPMLKEIPILGLIHIGLAEKHPFPEATHNRSVPFLVAGQSMAKGSLRHALAESMAASLEQNGVFAEVRYVDNYDPELDLRRYDYFVEGEILSAEARVWDFNYGLACLGIVDLSPVLHLFALPAETTRSTLSLRIRVIERTSGRLVYEEILESDPAQITSGYYYGRNPEGMPPVVELLRRMAERDFLAISSRIGAALP